MSGVSASPTPALCGHLFWPIDRWQALQADRFIQHLRHARTSPLYREHTIALPDAIPPDAIASFLDQLPRTTKDQLTAAGPEAWAVPSERIAEWVCTSGTAGKPLDVPLTRGDLDRLTENEAVALSLAGVRQGDLFLLGVGMDRMFVAGLAYWLGAQRLGATCVRIGPQVASHPEMLDEFLTRLQLTPTRQVFVITVPSFLSFANAPTHPLTGIISIGEPVRGESLAPNSLGQRLHDRFLCPVTSTYASTETCVTFAEGPLCKGGHLNPALGMLEILDDAGHPVPAGQVGEVVITPLGMEGMPLLRFRTGDMAAIFTDPCPCGRTTPRLGPILGRRQQLLKVRGTSLFPSAIIDALRASSDVIDCVVVAETQEALSDALTAYINVHDETPAVRERIESRLRAVLRVTPTLHFATAESLLRLQLSTGNRKPLRFLDRRVGGAWRSHP
jgi:phenylacetate-CoA ligase